MARVPLGQLYARLLQIMPCKPAPSKQANHAPPMQGQKEASPGCGKTTTQSGAQIWDPKGQLGQWRALPTLFITGNHLLKTL